MWTQYIAIPFTLFVRYTTEPLAFLPSPDLKARQSLWLLSMLLWCSQYFYMLLRRASNEKIIFRSEPRSDCP